MWMQARFYAGAGGHMPPNLSQPTPPTPNFLHNLGLHQTYGQLLGLLPDRT